MSGEKANNRKAELIRFIKFVLFSASAGLIQIGAFTLLFENTGWPYWACYLIALILSVLWNFTLNREFTFRSANNVPVAMAKVAAFYAVFTPITTFGGNYLTETAGWNAYVVAAGTMALNLITEFIYDRIFVFGSSLDTNTWAQKHAERGEGLSVKFEGLENYYHGYFLHEEDMDAILDCHADGYKDYPMYEALFGWYNSNMVRRVFWRILMGNSEGVGIYLADSPEVNCMSLWEPPYFRGGSIMSYARYGGLKLPKGMYGRLLSFQRYTLKLRDKYGPDSCWYLLDPVWRRDDHSKALAHEMLTSMFAYIDSRGEGTYLETHTQENLELFKQYGFELKEEGRVLKTDQPHYVMYRNPRPAYAPSTDVDFGG